MWEMGKRRYEIGGGGILDSVADIGDDVVVRISNIYFFMEIMVVVFKIPMRQEIDGFGQYESWSMDVLDDIFGCDVDVSAC